MTSRQPQLYSGLASASLVSFELHQAIDAALHATRVEGNTLEGLRLARRAMALAKVEDSAGSIVEALNLLAICQAANGAYIEAIAGSIDAFHAAKKLQDRLAMAHAMATLSGASSAILETPDVSLGMLDECLKFALQLNNVSLQLRVRNLRGLVFDIVHRHKDSENEFIRAMQLVPFAGKNIPRAMVAANHAHVVINHACAATIDRQRVQRHGTQEDAATSLTYANLLKYARSLSDAALEMTRVDRNRMSESIARFDRGKYFVLLGDTATASDEFKRAMLFAKIAKQGARVAQIHVEVAKICLMDSDPQGALAEYESALVAADSHRPLRLISRIFDEKSRVQRMLGNFKRAEILEDLAGKEASIFLRESEQTRRMLTEFWKQLPREIGVESTSAP